MAKVVQMDLRSWCLGDPEQGTVQGNHRVSLDVGGVPLWFESPDVTLRPDKEPFLAALLFPALCGRLPLRSRSGIDPVLLSGLRELEQTYAEWWGYPADVTRDLWAHEPPAEPPVEPSAALATRVGVCFSGGVDSFYCLLTSGRPVDCLLLVHGFDIPLADRRRWEHAEAALRDVAGEMGKQAIVVRTNLREHPIHAGIEWQRSHGAALAAVGHTLSGTMGTLLIPPSYQCDRLRPWGSDPRTDPLYATTRLKISHPASPDGRPGRIAAIAHHPLVRKHLRVCFENRTPQGNCSRCEKCLSTMTALAGVGQLSEFASFDSSISLATLIDQLPAIRHHTLAIWKEIETLDQSEDVRHALARLFTRQPPTGLWRAYWRLRRHWFFRRRSQAA